MIDKMREKTKNISEKKGVVQFFFLGPYFILFTLFIILAVAVAIILSFTDFDTISSPSFVGLDNYISILTADKLFMQTVLPNTIKFAVIVGIGGYILSFIVAWALAQVTHKLRTVLAIIFYSPSMTMGVAMVVVWGAIFSGDKSGYLNSLLMKIGMMSEPIQWLASPNYLMTIMIIVSLWSSMGVGFLAMLAGVLNINKEIYEAASIDGMSNRFQEIFYITIPMMKPQMLFGAVMAIVNTLQAGAIGVALTGVNPTPQYAGQLIVNHIDDYGFIRYEMGYAAALSVVLLLMILGISKYINKKLSTD